MTIEFGTVKYYNSDKGFGFIGRTFSNVDGKIFFHITKIRTIDPELAQFLDNGKGYKTVTLWYEIELTEKGEQVGRFWLNGRDISENYIHELSCRVEEIWKDINSSKPSWLECVTKEVFGDEKLGQLRIQREQEEERKKLHQQNEQRRNEIRNICNRIGIESLVHFTRLENLENILEFGLIGRSQLDEMGFNFIYNDDRRIDFQREAICLSISFPNYRMFFKYRQKSSDSKWVVLLLNRSVLWELNCKFYRENAASNNARVADLIGSRSETSALMEMFEDYEGIERNSLNILNNFTTNPQAEVLVFDKIDPCFIDKVCFNSVQDMKQWDNLDTSNYPQRFSFNPYYFRPRNDYIIWQAKKTDV